MPRYEVTFHVTTPTMHGKASYTVNAKDADDAVAEAKARAARAHIPTITAVVDVEKKEEAS